MKEETKRRIAKRVKDLRIKQGKTQEEVARGTGFTDAFISKLENKKTAISIKALEILADYFEVELAYLLTPEHDWYRILPNELQDFVREENIDYLEVGLKAKENGWTPEAIKEVIDNLSKNAPKQ